MPSLLKVLSSEMDEAKSGLPRRFFIKERGSEIVSNFARPPSCEGTLKIQQRLVQMLAIKILIANVAITFIAM
jgi:hypothetical protein